MRAGAEGGDEVDLPRCFPCNRVRSVLECGRRQVGRAAQRSRRLLILSYHGFVVGLLALSFKGCAFRGHVGAATAQLPGVAEEGVCVFFCRYVELLKQLYGFVVAICTC